MQFTSIPFAYYFALVASLAWALRSHRTAQKLLLLVASYFFYARWDLRLLGLLAGASLANYLFGELIARLERPGPRRAAMVLGILANVALLGTFKLYDFFREQVGEMAAFLGLSSHLPVLELFLPAGISFYTFQGIAYVVDTARGTAHRPKSLLDFLLFMGLFPKLMAGPICRSHELLPQIEAPAPARLEAPSLAVTLIASGLFKKMVLAAYLNTHLVQDAFQIPSNYSSLELLLAAYAYTMEIYLDFSGYTDMARGLGLLLGFRLPENFAYPYAATNIGDFWKRWHITFSRWLREYLYFPLGGSRGSAWRTSFNLIVTFLVCGIWHGTRWGFIVWGLLHGVALAAYRRWVNVRPGGKRLDASWWRKAWGCMATLAFCVLVRIFFRTDDLATASEYIATLAKGTLIERGIDPWVVAITVLTFALNFYGRPLFEGFVALHERLPKLTWPLAWVGVLVVMLALKTREVSDYIYFGF